jgi:hypothetical protein
MRRLLLKSVLVFAFLLLASPLAYGQTDHPVAYPLAAPVVLDGQYTSASEWSDTSELPIELGVRGTVAYFSVKYDANNMYSIWDFVECQKMFDGNQSNGNYPNQVLMYLGPLSKQTSTSVDPSFYRIDVFTGTLTGKVEVSKGTSSGGWTDWDSSNVGISQRIRYVSSAHAAVSHMILELKVPLTYANLKAQIPGKIVAAIDFSDYWTEVFADYPFRWHYKDPSSWGVLDFVSAPIPEFPMTSVPLILSVLSVFVLLRLRRRPVPP